MSVSRVKWEAFCDTLKQAGELLTADGVPQDEQTQAEGLRYLSRIARAALEWYVEFNDPEFPELYKPSHETIKIGADNPDSSAALRKPARPGAPSPRGAPGA